MNIVGAFVGGHGFQIGHVAEYWIITHNPVGSKDVAGHPGDFQSHGDVVALGHGNLIVAEVSRVFELPQTKGQQLSLGDFRQHMSQFVLNQLMGGNGFAGKLPAFQRPASGRIEADHGTAEYTPGDAIASLIQAR